jgi:hypothetical protein
MAKRYQFTLTGTVEFDGDVWTARCNELGLFMYGDTAEVASSRMARAIDLWTNILGKKDLLQKKLSELSVTYLEVSNNKPALVVRHGRKSPMCQGTASYVVTRPVRASEWDAGFAMAK